MRYALVVHAGFRLRDAEVRGVLVIVLSVASLDKLIRAVESGSSAKGAPRCRSPLLHTAMVRWLNDWPSAGVFTTDTDAASSELESHGWRRRPGRSAAAVVGRPLFEVFPEIVSADLDRYYTAALRAK